jgi:lipopolysaccharide/colanic/teichoic acid biosynthesis glycosyltransferase
VRTVVRCRRGPEQSDRSPILDRQAVLAAALRAAADRRPLFAAKRVLDVVIAAIALIVLLPLFAVVAVAVRVTTPGPALFTQLRYGRRGVPFRIYKFRTFYADRADPSGQKQTTANDERVTPLGRLLRRTNIDELPQFWNVLIGDMSVVGPRPHAIGMRACGMLYEDLVPAYHLRHLVKPGITGLAQVRGFRGVTTARLQARGRVFNDLLYIQRAGIRLDIEILLATLVQEIREGTGS